LPQGVSDYAVGGVMRSAAAPMSERGYLSKSEAKANYGLAQDASVGPKKKDGAKVKSFDIAVSGGLTKTAVQNIIRRHQGDIENCLANQGPGKLVITLSVNADGTIKNVRTGLKNKAVEQCIIAMMKNWKFPVASKGTEVKITLVVSR